MNTPPNKIEYITLHNPEGVAKLVYDKGYEVPDDPEELTEVVKALIRKEGKPVIRALLTLHTDRKAIIKAKHPGEDNYCGGCGSHAYRPENNYCGGCGHVHYDGEHPHDLLDRLKEMGIGELENYYERIMRHSNERPNDATLASEVQLVWDHLRQRKKEEQHTPADTPPDEKPSSSGFGGTGTLVVLGLTFIAGIVVGTAIRPST